MNKFSCSNFDKWILSSIFIFLVVASSSSSINLSFVFNNLCMMSLLNSVLTPTLLNWLSDFSFKLLYLLLYKSRVEVDSVIISKQLESKLEIYSLYSLLRFDSNRCLEISNSLSVDQSIYFQFNSRSWSSLDLRFLRSSFLIDTSLYTSSNFSLIALILLFNFLF